MSNTAYLNEVKIRKLKANIVAAGLDIGKVAQKMQISRSTLSARINGKTDFTKSEMEHFAEILGQSPQDIFFAN